MKKLIVTILTLFLPCVLLAQAGPSSVRTETTNNLKHHKQTAGVDTIKTAKFFVGVIINKSVASDTIVFYNKSRIDTTGGGVPDTIAAIVLGSTAPSQPFFVRYDVRIDTLTVKKLKSSDITVVYRTGW